MSGSLGAYVAQVDAPLAAGQSLFEPSRAITRLNAPGEQVPSPPPTSGLSLGMGSTREEYQQNSRTSAALDADTDGQGSAGRSGNARARSAATAIRVTARAHADAIAPSVRSPAGARLLVSALDERLEAMQREINGAKAQQRLLAARLRQLAAAYRMTAPVMPTHSAPPGLVTR